MGLDLNLLPLDFDGEENGTNSMYLTSYTVLALPTGAVSWEMQRPLMKIAEPVGRPISSREGDADARVEPVHYGHGETIDGYGKPLTFVRAAQLAARIGRWRMHEPEGAGRLAAIVAYLRALPQRTRVVLFWR